ncbi:30S ribosomal protein S8 [Candidatus Poribacteria bacterium]|nr:30S ribosomal protein S8 [Candidatus Poribacteria bacterium]
MSMTDPLADMLTRVRNGVMRRKEQVDVPASKLHEAVARILVEEGYIQDYRRVEDSKQGMLTLVMKVLGRRDTPIVGIKRISKPGHRVYTDKDGLPRVESGLGIAVISTSQGVMTEKDCRKRGIGGEVLCYVW